MMGVSAVYNVYDQLPNVQRDMPVYTILIKQYKRLTTNYLAFLTPLKANENFNKHLSLNSTPHLFSLWNRWYFNGSSSHAAHLEESRQMYYNTTKPAV